MKIGTVTIKKLVCDVTSALRVKGLAEYSAMSGYTVNSAYKEHFAALRSSDTASESTCLFRKELNGSKIKCSTKSKLGHANDCASDGEHYYVVKGKSGSDTVEIECFNYDLTHYKTYLYKANHALGEPLKNLTNIESIGNGWFIVGAGTIYAVCYKFSASNEFTEVYRVKLPNTSGLKEGRREDYDISGQGICYRNNALYKIYTYKKPTEAHTKCNDIVKYNFPGNSPSFSGTASVDSIYAYDRSDIQTFEMEGISFSESGNLFVSANVVSLEGEADSIYQISLS
jgi:hypothetical protein